MRILPPSGPARMVAVTTAIALLTGAVGWLAGTRVRSPADAAAAHRPPPASTITVPVTERTLTATVNAQGTVSYGAPQPLTLTGSVTGGDSEAATTPLITKAPAANRTLNEGDVLLEVSGRPVFVLTGKVPMYRTLTRSSTGDDAMQVRAALRRLLPNRRLPAAGPLDDQALNAVKAWYNQRGYDAAGPTAAQKSQLRTLEAAATNPAGKADLAEFKTTYGISIASGEILFLPKLPVRLTTVTVKAGAAPTGTIGTVADPTLVVDGTVSADDAKLLKVGLPATMEHPDGDRFPATLSGMGASVAPPAAPPVDKSQNSGQGNSQGSTDSAAAGIPIRLAPKNPAQLVPFADQAFKVTITVGSTQHPVLTVPVAAVFTTADGQARVSVQDAAGRVLDVPVVAGLSTGGNVQVTPTPADALKAGDRVVVGSR